MTYSDILGSLNLQDTPERLTQTTNVLPEATLQPFWTFHRPRNHNAIAIAWELQDTISGGIADVDGIILAQLPNQRAFGWKDLGKFNKQLAPLEIWPYPKRTGSFWQGILSFRGRLLLEKFWGLAAFIREPRSKKNGLTFHEILSV